MLLGAHVPKCDMMISEGPSYLTNISLFSCLVCCALVHEASPESCHVCFTQHDVGDGMLFPPHNVTVSPLNDNLQQHLCGTLHCVTHLSD